MNKADSKKIILKIFIRIVISLILIIVLLQMMDIEELASVFSLIPLSILSIAVFILVLCVFVNATKWKVLLKDVPLKELVFCCFRAQFFSTILPGQLFGETSKIILTRDYDRKRVAASVVFDKYTGMISQVVVAIIGLLVAGKVKRWAITILVYAVILLFPVFLSQLRLFDGITNRLSIYGKQKNSRIAKAVVSIMDSWNCFSRDNRITFVSIFWGIINQMLGVLACFLVSNSVGIDISCWDYCWILTMVNLMLILPISYAGVGVRDISFVSMFSWLGGTSAQAIIISAVFLIAQFVEALIGGICILIRNISDIREYGAQ